MQRRSWHYCGFAPAKARSLTDLDHFAYRRRHHIRMVKSGNC